MDGSQRYASSDVTASLFVALEHRVMPAIEIEEARLVSHAKQLAVEFRQRKQLLHAACRSDPHRRTEALYSPLVLAARHHKGSLELTWREVHQVPSRDGVIRRKRYVHIPMGDGGGYNIVQLRKRATYDADLVEEFEHLAREVRQCWRQLMSVKRAVRHALQRMPEGIEAVAARLESTRMDRPIPRSRTGLDPIETASTV